MARCKHQNCWIEEEFKRPISFSVCIRDGDIYGDASAHGEGTVVRVGISIKCRDCGMDRRYRKTPKWVQTFLDRYHADDYQCDGSAINKGYKIDPTVFTPHPAWGNRK